MRRVMMLSVLSVMMLTFVGLQRALADECIWRITTHLSPEPRQYWAAQESDGQKVWGWVGADYPGTYRVWSFDPWEGFDDSVPDSICQHWIPAVAVLDGSAYLISGGTTCVERYTPGVGWEQLADIPSVKNSASAEVLDGKIYVFGGYGGPGGGGLNAETCIYDPATDTWTIGPEMNHAGGNRASAVVGDAIYAMGGAIYGSSDTGGQTWFEKYEEGIGWIELDPLPVARNTARATPVRGKIYLAGGRSGSSGTIDNRVWVFDTAAPELGWTEIQGMAEERQGHALATFGIGIYSIGGNKFGHVHETVECFITSADCCTSSDVDGDTDVDLADLAELLAHYGESCP